jgi:hypothetical protein
MERQLRIDLMNCDNNKEVSEVIAQYKDFLKTNPVAWNHIFRARKRINLVAKEKDKNWINFLN